MDKWPEEDSLFDDIISSYHVRLNRILFPNLAKLEKYLDNFVKLDSESPYNMTTYAGIFSIYGSEGEFLLKLIIKSYLNEET